MSSTSSILENVNRLFRKGDTDSLSLAQVEALEKLAGGAGSSPAQVLQAKAYAAQYHLLTIHKNRAAHVLSPYVDTRGNHEVLLNRQEIEELASEKTHQAGLVLAQIANLLYRYFQHEDGALMASRANDILRLKDDRDLDRSLAEHENRIWWARIQWHREHFEDASRLLRETIRDLTLLMEGVKEPGGIHHLVALALDLWASFDLRTGDLDRARRKIYQALFLLQGGAVRSKVRLGHALYMAGRIEMGHSQSMTWPLHLFEHAAQTFRSARHQFEYRTRIQKAQCLSRAGSGEAASSVVQEIENDLKGAELDVDEQRFVEADILLTKVWLQEALARERPAEWAKCAALAKQLVNMEHLPSRLHFEGELHYGLALVHDHDSVKRRSGKHRLEQTIAEARGGHRSKVEAAAQLGLVEYYLEENELVLARGAHEAARRILVRVRSSFLYRWQKRLAEFVDGAALQTIDVRPKYDEALLDFKRRYVDYHQGGQKKTKDVFEEMGLTMGRGYRLLGDVDPKKPKTPKKAKKLKKPKE